MKFHVYIHGNSIGRVSATRDFGHIHIAWPAKVRDSLKRVGALESCTDAILELFKGGYSYATFGNGIGELKVV